MMSELSTNHRVIIPHSRPPLAHFDLSHFLWVGLTPFRSFMMMSHSSYKPKYPIPPFHTSTMFQFAVLPRNIFFQTDHTRHPSNSGIRRFIWEYFQGLN